MLQQKIHDHRPTVAVQFQHVFASEGVRGREVQRQSLIERRAVRIAKRCELCMPRTRQLPEEGARDVRRLIAGNTHDTDTAAPRRGGDGCDSVAW